MLNVLDVERGYLVDDNDIGEEKNNGDGEGGEEPPHCFTGTWPWKARTLKAIS